VAIRGIKITDVEAGSIGDRIGLSAGDVLLSVNGHSIPDELALKYHLAEEYVAIGIQKPNGIEVEFEVDLSEGDRLGIRVEDFRTRTCNNACLFCFIDQLPEGTRPSLKIKDDDYRLSFLHGNYITLTNLPERELDRIVEHRLSPLYVSVHASDPELRARMLGRRKLDDLDRKLRKLIDGGIVIHAQIVLMPGINDGEHLERSMSYLFGYYPGVASAAIVPLGLSEHGTPKERFTPVTPDFCREIIRLAASWQEKFRDKTGRTFAYLADEFYIQGGVQIPTTAYYDDFAQIEDGVGMVRNFLDQFEIEIRKPGKKLPNLKGTVVTAKLFSPFLTECMKRFNGKFGSRVQVRELDNRYLGKSITVAGLLGGNDILSGLQDFEVGDFLLVPSEAISRIESVFLDDLSPADLANRLGRPVYPGGRTVAEFFSSLRKLS
jgi:putative radical SAM enzyme (TIGR03279 family)